MDRIRSQLDELMGKDRNLSLVEKNRMKEHYDDPDVILNSYFLLINNTKVCKYALVSTCPHDLFPNTKCDLGVYLKTKQTKIDILTN